MPGVRSSPRTSRRGPALSPTPGGCFSSSSGRKPLHAVAGLLLVGILLTVLFAISSWRHVVIALGLLATLLVVRRPGLNLGLRDDVSKAVGYSPYQGTGRFVTACCSPSRR
jgi:hypothetical protein